MDLYQYFVSQTGKSIIKNPHYFPIYERHFRRFVEHEITMLEIGTGEGGSAIMWKYYFGHKAKIVTIDIKQSSLKERQIYARTGSQADTKFLQTILDEFGPPDIVLDDGSHMMEQINSTFDFIFPRMSPKGTYLVEDLDGAYWSERGGGLRTPASFVERAKNLVDGMNASYLKGDDIGKVEPESLSSVSFYPMIVVLEKATYSNNQLIRLPAPMP